MIRGSRGAKRVNSGIGFLGFIFEPAEEWLEGIGQIGDAMRYDAIRWGRGFCIVSPAREWMGMDGNGWDGMDSGRKICEVQQRRERFGEVGRVGY